MLCNIVHRIRVKWFRSWLTETICGFVEKGLIRLERSYLCCLVWGHMLCKIFITDLQALNAFMKFVDKTRLEQIANTEEEWIFTQKGSDSLVEWGGRNGMSFNSLKSGTYSLIT